MKLSPLSLILAFVVWTVGAGDAKPPGGQAAAPATPSDSAPPHSVKSPDGQIVIRVTPTGSVPTYTVSWRGKQLIGLSRLGLEAGGKAFPNGVRITGQKATTADTTWRPLYGERSEVRDHYNQLVLDLEERAESRRRLQVIFRAYNQGVAFCYAIPEQPSLSEITIAGEKTEFRLDEDYSAWAAYTAQGVCTKVSVGDLRQGCERPLVIRAGNDCYLAIVEARLVDYARMKLSPHPSQRNCLVADLDGFVKAKLPLRTPWRVVMLGNTPGQLLEQNDIILNLNDPCAIADTSWIKPGKVIREVTLTTAGGKACVDFAAKHNLQFIEFDAGWYGPEGDKRSDARAVNVDPARSKGPLDLPEVIRYAGEHGVGVILYVNHLALERQLDEILPLYRKWGVKGIKFGFVNVGNQKWTTWLHEAIRKAADHQLMVDVHDEYRPTGFSRTYPNLMTQEGIRGDEERQPNEQTLTTLFTRMLAGAADNTICYYDSRVTAQSSHAYQLAKAVCLYSPWQFLFWYDRPQGSPPRAGGAGNSQSSIRNEPELEFFEKLPTVWDDTKILQGRIGEFAVVARRSGETWFLGAMNNDEPREIRLPLSFLRPGKKYEGAVYLDDTSVRTVTHVRIDRRPANREQIWKLHLPARGGQAIRFVPQG